MNVSLPPKIRKFIDTGVKSGRYRSADALITEAIANLQKQQSFGDFAPGELDSLIAEGERDIKNGDLFDVDEVFAQLRRRSGNKRAKST